MDYAYIVLIQRIQKGWRDRRMFRISIQKFSMEIKNKNFRMYI